MSPPVPPRVVLSAGACDFSTRPLFLAFASCHHPFAPVVVLSARASRAFGDSVFDPVSTWPGQYLQHSCNTHRGVAFTDHSNFMATAIGSTLPGYITS